MPTVRRFDVLLLAAGIVAVVVGLVRNHTTADDGNGADIGAGGLVLLGATVFVVGVMRIVLQARSRNRP
jgi:uncharacterized membrane protein